MIYFLFTNFDLTSTFLVHRKSWKPRSACIKYIFNFSCWLITNQIFVCLAKGRTNVELREQFTLASGVSQSMTPFKSKPRDRSPSGSISGESQRPSVSGPITKVIIFYFLSKHKLLKFWPFQIKKITKIFNNENF